MAVTTFIPELWSARLLYNLDKAHVATNLVNRNYEGEITQAGDTVHINSIGAITISDYTKNTDISSPEALSTSEQTLVIDQQKYFNFQVDDIDKVQAAGELMDEAMARAAYGLAEVADEFILSTIADGVDSNNVIGSTTSPVALTSSNVYSNIVKLRLKLDKSNLPKTGRSIVVPPEVYALLLEDDHFVKSDSVAGQDALINGMVGRVAGFEVYESNNVPYDSTGKYWTITAQSPYATTYAEQILETKAYSPEKRFADAMKGLHVYGAKVTDGKGIAALYAKV